VPSSAEQRWHSLSSSGCVHAYPRNQRQNDDNNVHFWLAVHFRLPSRGVPWRLLLLLLTFAFCFLESLRSLYILMGQKETTVSAAGRRWSKQWNLTLSIPLSVFLFFFPFAEGFLTLISPALSLAAEKKERKFQKISPLRQARVYYMTFWSTSVVNLVGAPPVAWDLPFAFGKMKKG